MNFETTQGNRASLPALLSALLAGQKLYTTTQLNGARGWIVTKDGRFKPANYLAKIPYFLNLVEQDAIFVPVSYGICRMTLRPAPVSPLAKGVTIWAILEGKQWLVRGMGQLATAVTLDAKIIIEADIDTQALGVAVIRRNDKFLIDELYRTVDKPGWNGLAIYIPHQQYTTNTQIEENTMQDLSAILFGEELFAVSVHFKGSTKAYTYKSTKEYNQGDKVIVDSPQDGLVVVTVTSCRRGLSTDVAGFDSYKWLVGSVDMAEYNRLVEAERDFVRKAKQEAQRRDAIKKLADLGVSAEEYRKAILGE